MKISKLTASLLTSTAVFAGVMVAQKDAQNVSADSKLRVDYSANLRQKAGTDAKIIGGLNVGETYSYDKTAQANGYTWYQIGADQWVADAGATATSGQVKVNYAANKRAGASTSHKVVGSYYPGQVLNFTETKQANGYTWYKVGTDAWVASAGVSEYTDGQAVAAPAAQTQAPSQAATTTPAAPAQTAPVQEAAKPAAATVTPANGRVEVKAASNLRSGAGTSFSVAGSLPAGTIRSYTATATADGYTWYQVGTNAWVAGATPYYGTAATTATPAAPAQQTTQAAASSQAPAAPAQQAQAQTQTNTQASRPAQQPAQQQQAQQQQAPQQPAQQQQVATGNKTSSDSAGNAYAWGQCTWYVKSVAPWAGNHWGNGGQWGGSAAAEGFTVNNTPAVGSIVVVGGGQNFGGWTAAPGYGHVAYVVGVNGNSITVQQGGMGFGNPGGPNTQTVNGASSFTYIHR